MTERRITIDALKGRKYIVIQTDINGEEYDPDMPTTEAGWQQLIEHMRRKRWWTQGLDAELLAIKADHMTDDEFLDRIRAKRESLNLDPDTGSPLIQFVGGPLDGDTKRDEPVKGFHLMQWFEPHGAGIAVYRREGGRMVLAELVPYGKESENDC
jgi:hypothetical protein